jgi:hypothetical protein
MYDSYISLGSNCEAGFQFKRIGYNESSFFRWTLSSFESTYNLIQNNFQNLYLKDHLVPVWDNMVEDTKYKISFHSKLLSKIDQQNNRRYFLSDYNFDAIYQEEFQKLQYFVHKWNALVNSDQYVLYIIKQEQNSSKAQATKLLNLFEQKYPEHKFTIIYIQHKKYQEPDWGLNKLKNVYFPSFAPVDQADNGDIDSWNELFSKFPLI